MFRNDKKETASQGGVSKTVVAIINKLGQFVYKCCKVIITIILIMAIVAGVVLFVELERLEESQREWEDFSIARNGDGEMTILSSSGRTFSGGTTGTTFKLRTKEPLKGFPHLSCVLMGDSCSGSLKVSMIDTNASQYYKSAYFSPILVKQEKTLYMATYERGYMYAITRALVGENDEVLDYSKDPYSEKRIFDIYIKIDVPPGGNIFVNNFIVEGH